MVQDPAVSRLAMLWMRRAALCFVGVTSVTGALTLLLVGLLLLSGVFEW